MFPSLLSLLPLLLLPLSALASFSNTAIVRTIELGGSISVVTTSYQAKVVSDSPVSEYVIGLGREEEGKVGWFDVRMKSKGGGGGQLEWRRGRWDERRLVRARLWCGRWLLVDQRRPRECLAHPESH